MNDRFTPPKNSACVPLSKICVRAGSGPPFCSRRACLGPVSCVRAPANRRRLAGPVRGPCGPRPAHLLRFCVVLEHAWRPRGSGGARTVPGCSFSGLCGNVRCSFFCVCHHLNDAQSPVPAAPGHAAGRCAGPSLGASSMHGRAWGPRLASKLEFLGYQLQFGSSFREFWAPARTCCIALLVCLDVRVAHVASTTTRARQT